MIKIISHIFFPKKRSTIKMPLQIFITALCGIFIANFSLAAMDMSVRGKGVSFKDVGTNGQSHIYPLATRTTWEKSRYMKPGTYHIFDNRPSAIKGKAYATTPVGADYFTAVAETRKNYSLDAFKANEAGKVLIAVPTTNLRASGWRRISGSFNTSKDEYYFYEYDYKQAGQWVDIPKTNKDHPTLLFAESKNNLTFDNPLPISILGDDAVKISDAHSYIVDPAIAIMPNGDYIASSVGGPKLRGRFLRLWVSKDKGKSWQGLNRSITSLRHATLLVRGNDLYLIGDNSGPGGIRKSTDGGKYWSPITYFNFDFRSSPSHVVEAKGRYWVASEGNGGAKVISAPVNSDLLKASSWTEAKRSSSATAGTGNEADLMASRNGGYPIIMGKGNSIGRVLSKDEYTAIKGQDTLSLPMNGSKYTAMYDEASDKYWALTSYSSLRGNIRTGIALFSSKDGQKFTFERQILTGVSTAFHGFNYPFMEIDGDDIIFVLRTAWENDTGLSQRWHDGNMFTFHRVENFRNSQNSTSSNSPADSSDSSSDSSNDSDSGSNNSAVSSGYKSLVVRHSNKCLDVHGADKTAGANVEQYNCRGSAHQAFELINEDNGWYQIKAQHSGLCLDVQGYSSENGANVVQWDCKTRNSENQQFQMINQGGGWYSLQAKHSNHCLDIKAVSMDDGANLEQYQCNNQRNQQFKFQ